MKTRYEVTTTGMELTERLPGVIDDTSPTRFVLITNSPALAEMAMNRDRQVLAYRELAAEDSPKE